MKITRIKLVNFIGIKHGTNLDEIEINFSSDNSHKIVMLNGGNGSGKTTILSQLHPFKDSFDDRKTLILSGMDGIKEIDIEHNGSVYEIVHHYKKNAQSYIKKDGVEMNENGGVKTFNAYIESEFGVTSDYFKIGKIGSNTQNFIQFTTTERKTYITKFLPDIEDYLNSFAIIRDKFRISSEQIKTISGDLGKLENEVTVKSRIESLELIIKTIEADIEKKSGEIAVLQSDIDNYQKTLDEIDITKVIFDRSEKEKRRNELRIFGNEFIGKYSNNPTIQECEDKIKEKAALIKILGEQIAVLNSEKQNIFSSIITKENEEKKIGFNITGLDKTESVADIDEKIKKLEATVKDYSKNEDGLGTIVKTFKDISIQLSRFETFKNFIIKYFNNLREKTFSPNKSNIELFMEDNFLTKMDTYATSIRDLISGKQASLTSNETIREQKIKTLEKFSQSMDNSIDLDTFNLEICGECPLFQDALEYKELPNEIKEIETKIEQIKKDLNEFQIKAENFENLKILYRSFNTYYEQMNPRTNQVYIYFINNYGSFVNYILGDLNTFRNDTDEIVNKVNLTIEAIQNIAIAEADIENLKFKKSASENNEKIRKQYEAALNAVQKEIEQLKVDRDAKIKSIDKENQRLEDETIIFDDYNKLLTGKREFASLSTTISNANILEKEYNDKTKMVDSKKVELIKTTTELQELKDTKIKNGEELFKAKNILATIENLNDRKELLEKDYRNQKLVRDALDPNKGIPLYFIKAYLEKTQDIANDLLNLAFEGDFEINFITDVSDFFIQVRTGDNIKSDIKEASQGEIALTTISISLALIEQTIGTYNILCLDEIDGPLDFDNRENFLSILNTQIDKLGIEQVFVISHNDAFDTEAMDLILLKEHNITRKGDEFMKNKNIIFELK